MRIADGIHLLMSGGIGFDLTDRYDCNVFAVRAGADWLMFDAGGGRALDAALAVAAEDGIEAAAITHLFLTHGHADHSGGAAGLRERLGLTVHASAATAKLVAGGDEAGISLDVAKRAGVYPPDYVYRACPVDAVHADGAAITMADVRITPIATPGHSHDHVCYLVECGTDRILIAGDALFYGGRVVLQDTYDCSVPDTCASVRRLAEVDFGMFLPGHGVFTLKGGRRHVDTAMSYVERLLCPPAYG